MTWYRHDLRRLSLRERWRMARDFREVLHLLGCWLARSHPQERIYELSTDAPVEEVARDAVPVHVEGAMAPVIAEIERLGFASACIAKEPILTATYEPYFAILSSADRRTVAVVAHSRVFGGAPSVRTALLSTDGRATVVMTGSISLRDASPTLHVERLPDRSAAELWRRHDDRLRGWGEAIALGEPVALLDAVRAEQLRFEISRGLLHPLHDHEISHARAAPTNDPEGSGLASRSFEPPRVGTPLTYAIIALNALVFAACQTELGLARILETLDGSLPLALLLSAFVHVNVLHFAMNNLVLFQIGRVMEHWLRRPLYVVFFVLSAMVSSATEVVFAGTTGIGASGVLFAMVGYLWITSKRDSRMRRVFPPGAFGPIFAWLVVGFFLTASGVVNIGNAAHVGGLVFGVLVALLLGSRR